MGWGCDLVTSQDLQNTKQGDFVYYDNVIQPNDPLLVLSVAPQSGSIVAQTVSGQVFDLPAKRLYSREAAIQRDQLALGILIFLIVASSISLPTRPKVADDDPILAETGEPYESLNFSGGAHA